MFAILFLSCVLTMEDPDFCSNAYNNALCDGLNEDEAYDEWAECCQETETDSCLAGEPLYYGEC
jgi:hypothetical protein